MAWVEKSGAQTWRVRYRREDGTIGAINGFAGKTAASQHAASMESEQHQGIFIDPAAGKTTLRVWSQDWLGGIDVAVRTEDFYRSLLRRHILPAGAITPWPTSPGSRPRSGRKSCGTRATRRAPSAGS